MKKSLLPLLAIATFLGAANYAQAGDVPSCTTVTQTVNIYGGFASCSSNGHIVSQYVMDSPNSVAWISEYIPGQGYYSCMANIPYVGTDTYEVQQCTYTPTASFYVSQTPHNLAGTNIVTVGSNSTDRDGNIASYKWWVNGIVNTSTLDSGRILRLSTINGKNVTIKLQVTDNDGQTDTTTKSVYLQKWSCDRSCNLY